MLDGHSNKGYHKNVIERACVFRQTYANHMKRIDVVMSNISSESLAFNSKLLPTIAETVLTCAPTKIGSSRLPAGQSRFHLYPKGQ